MGDGDRSSAWRRGVGANEAASRAARRTPTVAASAGVGSGLPARPDRQARGELTAGCGEGSRAREGARGCRSPWPRWSARRAPRATARVGQRSRGTTTAGDGDDRAGARRRRTVVGYAKGATSLVSRLIGFSDPTSLPPRRPRPRPSAPASCRRPWRSRSQELAGLLVEVAPAPGIAGHDRPHDRVMSLVVVLGGVRSR